MKKMILAVFSAFALCACATMNRNTVSYQLSKIDTQRYYAVAGDGADKAAAAESALANMQKAFVQNVTDVMNTGLMNDMMANAKVSKVWRDKSRDVKHYFAIAVLERSTAEQILQAPMNRLDEELSGLSKRFTEPADKFADLKTVFKMQPLVVKRNVLDDWYQFVNASHEGYNTVLFGGYKTLMQQKLASVRVALDLTGTESEVLISYLTDAVNKLGLSPVEADADDVSIRVKIVTEVDGYESKRLEGLVWCASSASVSLQDSETGGTFARFSVHDRAGTGRAADSLRKSMEGVGEKAAAQVTDKLLAYLKTR